MTRATIEQLIVDALSAVDGIGTVAPNNTAIMGSMTPKTIHRVFGLSSKASEWNFWTVHRRATANDDSNTLPGQVPFGYGQKTYQWEIAGYKALVGDGVGTQEKQFQELIDRVIDAFDLKPSLSGRDAAPIELITVDTLVVAGRVSSRAILRISVTEAEYYRRGN